MNSSSPILAMELQGGSYLNGFNNEEKLQAEGGTISPNPDKKMVTQKTDGSCSTIMAFGYTKFPADHAQTIPALLDSCRSSEKVSTSDDIHFGSLPTNISGNCFNTCSNNQSTNSLSNARADALNSVPANAKAFTSTQMPRDSPCLTDGRCSDYTPVDTVLSLSLCGYTDKCKRTRKRSRICQSPELADEESGLSCYDPSQPNVSDTNLSLSISTPESILKSSAISYRNTPSIIRRKTYREAASGICFSTFSSPMRAAERKYDDSSNLASERGCLPSHDIRSGSSVIGEAVERRLEHAFDLELDSNSVKCFTPGSPQLKADKKIMLSP